MLKVQLTRDLRKNILRGHPWVYREAIALKKPVQQACLCQVVDKKGQGLSWALYSPEGPLALRILSTDKKPPQPETYRQRLARAYALRAPLRRPDNNCYRLLNGEGDRLPGVVCDIYHDVAVLQFDGDACFEFWDQQWWAEEIRKITDVATVFVKPRRSDDRDAEAYGEPLPDPVVDVLENGVTFLVNVVEGQKTGFFLDQRDNRQYLQTLAKNKTVLNLFSYTGGFSVYAGLGEAESVTSVDLSKPALELADQAWARNGLKPSRHTCHAGDVFGYLEQLRETFDIVMVDPPSMTHSEKTKNQAVVAYTDLFAKASRVVSPGGHLVLSSCSSHISFNDFLAIIDEALSKGRRTGQILRISGQGMDHPIPHFCRELRYLKFVDVVLDS